MPEATLPKQLRNRDRLRLADYARFLRFYNGIQWKEPAPRKSRRLTFNYIKTFVHKSTAYLMRGRTPTVEPFDDSDSALDKASEAETAIMQVWEANDLRSLDFDTELDAAVLGDGVFKVYWDEDENRVRISSPDPAGIFAWYWPDDPSRLWRVANRYEIDAATITNGFKHLTLPKLKDRNIIIEDWTIDGFEMWVNDTRVDVQPNPYDFIPFVIFPNIREPKQLWGTSEVPALMDAQRELNRELTQLSLILELSGNPIAVLENVTESEDISVRPGAVWELPDKAKAYLLDLLSGGGVKLHIDYLAAIYRTMHDIAETPRSAFGDTTRDLSGVALELELDPLVKKVDRKRLIRTTAYTDRNTMILRLLDQFAGTEFGVVNHTITWGSILPTDRDRKVANEVSLVAARIHSRRFATDELGGIDDPDAEFERILEEERQLERPETQ